jgi:ATPase family associated with various cellular activities (AAA)
MKQGMLVDYTLKEVLETWNVTVSSVGVNFTVKPKIKLRNAMNFSNFRSFILIKLKNLLVDQSNTNATNELFTLLEEYKQNMSLTLNNEQLAVLLLALVPHAEPYFLNQIIAEVLPQGGNFPEIGGMKDANNRYIYPTGETAIFILAGYDVEKRLEVQKLFSSEQLFHKKGILRLESVKEGEPNTVGRLILDPEYVELFLHGRVTTPKFSADFPAERVTTALEWDDLVLPNSTTRQIGDIHNWIQHQSTLMIDWGMARHIKPGFRTLFYGPPGTGKTLTATLLGKYTGREVFRIDLSMIVSKYIGETEKNLSKLFDKAQDKNWILFFDEADALFGKRTGVRDAHDKYANQEVSYLLQRVESYPGLVILASNFKTNIDDAFMRRFQAVINFPLPKSQERLVLWQKAMPSALSLSEDIDLPNIAAKYELSGSNIVNIIQYCGIKTLSLNSNTLSADVLQEGLERELSKEGKII